MILFRKILKILKRKSGELFNNECEFEPCIICGKITHISKTLPVEYRSYYIKGCGQLCYDCHNRIYPEAHKHKVIPSDERC